MRPLSEPVRVADVHYVSGDGVAVSTFLNCFVTYVAGGVVIGFATPEATPNHWITVYYPNTVLVRVESST